MNVLVLGANGMLGHQLMQMLSTNFNLTGTVRGSVGSYNQTPALDGKRLIGGVDTNHCDRITQVFSHVKPHVVVNCVGVIKQLETANDPLTTITVNSLFPHRLANLCAASGVRLIHVSTDCVFSGASGPYHESDLPDATDLYGRTKLLGEVNAPNCLTLRTSIIGRELGSHYGLVEWFLRQDKKEVRGFRKALYTGLTTIEFARVIHLLIETEKKISGVYNVSSDSINKYDLLLLLRDTFGMSTKVVPSDTPVIDRRLDSTRFRQEMDYTPPTWTNMIQELASKTNRIK